LTKIFCDIADIKLIRNFNKKKIVKGFTTNPTLMRKAGAEHYSKYSKKILKITKKPISFEVFADDIKNMILQGVEISKWGKNVYVKVPITNSKGRFMGKVIKYLNKNNIKLNITAVYSSKQTSMILKNINKKTKVIISIFAGRMADAGKDPIPQFKKSLKLSKNYKNVEILWASTREPYNYLQAKKLGCQIITVPPNIINKIENFGKSFKTLTKNTVRGFLIDTKKSKFVL
jgi:transaldolase|tara:strand:+ start:35 stop:727 length:693 start_codon:yes stop_codon:yes gene_type:complete